MIAKLPRSERNRKAVEEMRKGQSMTETATKYGISPSNIIQLKQRYVDVPTELPTSINKIRVLQEFKYGDMKMGEISFKYGLSPSVLAVLKSRYMNTPAWDLIPPPEWAMERANIPKGYEQPPVQDPIVEREWREDSRCTGCGRLGIVRINICGNNCGTGISLCKKCLTLISQEVIATMNKWGVENAQ